MRRTLGFRGTLRASEISGVGIIRSVKLRRVLAKILCALLVFKLLDSSSSTGVGSVSTGVEGDDAINDKYLSSDIFSDGVLRSCTFAPVMPSGTNANASLTSGTVSMLSMASKSWSVILFDICDSANA